MLKGPMIDLHKDIVRRGLEGFCTGDSKELSISPKSKIPMKYTEACHCTYHVSAVFRQTMGPTTRQFDAKLSGTAGFCHSLLLEHLLHFSRDLYSASVIGRSENLPLNAIRERHARSECVASTYVDDSERGPRAPLCQVIHSPRVLPGFRVSDDCTYFGHGCLPAEVLSICSSSSTSVEIRAAREW